MWVIIPDDSLIVSLFKSPIMSAFLSVIGCCLFQGEIALAFGDLLRRLWAPGATPVAPRTFKSKLARFAPQFSGFNQHDSQVY